MTLSLVLIILIPLFILPAILLPLNRLRVFLIGTTSAFLVVAFIYLLNSWTGKSFIEQTIGKYFLFLSSFFYVSKIELSMIEIYHISFSFFLLALYLIIYFVVLLFTTIFYVGNNPSFHKQLKFVQKFFVSILFFVTTFSIVFFFFVNIRLILPIRDGLFENIFSLFYKIEA